MSDALCLCEQEEVVSPLCEEVIGRHSIGALRIQRLSIHQDSDELGLISTRDLQGQTANL